MPVRPPLAQVVATRTGLGGIVGQKRKYFSWRFVVDFAGSNLSMLGKDVKLEPVITTSHGQIEITSVRPLEAVRGYRVMFDLNPTDTSVAPISAQRSAVRFSLHAMMFIPNALPTVATSPPNRPSPQMPSV